MLEFGEYHLVLAPTIGGAIQRFDWREKPVMRPSRGTTVLDSACFPLVPFSNRIASGAFEVDGRPVRIQPNFPGHDHPHPLHGFGWLSSWTVIRATRTKATLRLHHAAGEWPWRFVAEQYFILSETGLRHTLRICNLDHSRMPAGLGFHPYLPRSDAMRYFGLHRGQWRTASDGLPIMLDERPEAIDWWNGQPVASRAVDTVYTGRSGPLIITWPDRNLSLRMCPSANLGFTAIYVPGDADFVCVEPVSHMTDAIHHPDLKNGLVWLEPGAEMVASVLYQAAETSNLHSLS